MTLADELNARIGLPHNATDLSAARRDKLLMMTALGEAGLPATASFHVRNLDDLRQRSNEFSDFPVVLKPRNSACGDGVRVCRSVEEVEAAFRAIDGHPNVLGLTNVGAIVQQYLDGDQFGVSTVSLGGRHLVSEFSEEGIDFLPTRSVERNHVFMRWPDDADSVVVDFVLRCLDALGVREGPAFTEVRLTSEGPRLVEVNCRLGGPILDPDPYWVARGHSPQHLVVERYLQPDLFKERLDISPKPQQCLGYAYLRPRSRGVIRRIGNFAQLRALPAFHSVHRVPRPGTQVEDFSAPNSQTCAAYFIHSSPTVVRESIAAAHTLETDGMFSVEEADTQPAA